MTTTLKTVVLVELKMELVRYLHPTGNPLTNFGVEGGCQGLPFYPKSSRTGLDLHMLIWRTVEI